jgi:hypothetical protein
MYDARKEHLDRLCTNAIQLKHDQGINLIHFSIT